MPGGFVAALRAHARELLQLEVGQARELARLVEGLRAELSNRLAGIGPTDISLNAFNIQKASAEAETAIFALRRIGTSRLDATADRAAQMAAVHLGEDFERLSRRFDDMPLRVSFSAARQLARRGLVAEQIESSLEKYGVELLQRVKQRLFIGLRVGDSLGTVTKAIAGDTGPFGEVGQQAAKTIAGTEISNAYGAAQHSGIIQAAGQEESLKKVWLHIGSYPCPVCMPLHGTERPVGETWTVFAGKKYERKVQHPPAHPRCVCRITAMRPSWRKSLAKLGYLKQDPDLSSSKPTDV